MHDGADPAAVGRYLSSVTGDQSWAGCDVDLISGGKSNLTYLVTSAAGELVLRRPPLGHVLPTAHDMVREHTVISALGPTAVPVPATVALCTDHGVIGAPFFVMERVSGPVVRDAFPAGYADRPAQRAAVADGLIQVLAELHAVSYHDVGLGEFGRPEGYLARQVGRWAKQWDASRTADPKPGLDTLAGDLAARVPNSGPPTIVHGDYRLDNTVLHPELPGRIAAVLDWEMSTLGDPLADVGLLLVYWSQASDATDPRRGTLIVPSITNLPGFPDRAGVAAAYAARTGRDISALPWYVAFGFFKLAVVCAGILARVEGGAMVGGGFDHVAATIDPLIDLGARTLAADALDQI